MHCAYLGPRQKQVCDIKLFDVVYSVLETLITCREIAYFGYIRNKCPRRLCSRHQAFSLGLGEASIFNNSILCIQKHCSLERMCCNPNPGKHNLFPLFFIHNANRMKRKRRAPGGSLCCNMIFFSLWEFGM